MKPLLCLALAASLGLPMAVHAVDAVPAARLPEPQDAQASVAPIVYRSAFDSYVPAAEEDATPDETWRAVNRKVGQAGGHMGQMGKMKNHTMPMPMSMPTPAAARDAAPAPVHQHEGH